MERREDGPLCGWAGFEGGKKISEGCGGGGGGGCSGRGGGGDGGDGTWKRENAWPQEVPAAHGDGGLEAAFGLPGLAVFLQEHP